MKYLIAFGLLVSILSCGTNKMCQYIIDDGKINTRYDLTIACEKLSKIKNHKFYIFYQSKTDTLSTVTKVIKENYGKVYYSTENWSILIIDYNTSKLYMINTSKLLTEETMQRLSKIRREIYSSIKNEKKSVVQIINIIDNVWNVKS